MGDLTILWTEMPASDATLIRPIAASDGATLEQVARHLAPGAIVTALARGGVVYLATDADDARRALGLGADEVLRVGHLSRAGVQRALKRASLRASARATRAELASRAPADVGKVLALLTAAVGHEMNTPLSVALLTCEALTEGLPPMLDAQELLLGWAALSAPAPELRRLVGVLARHPGPSELRAMLSDLRDGIGRAAHVAHLVRRLAEKPGGSTASATDTLADVHELLRGAFGDTDARVETAGRCLVRVERPTLVLFVSALLAHAMEAVGTVPVGERRLTLRASEEDDAVLIEVGHNGRTIPTDLRPGVLEPYFALASSASGEMTIEGLQTRAQSLGGDLLVLSEEGVTTFRLVLPGVEGELALNAQSGERSAASKGRRTD